MSFTRADPALIARWVEGWALSRGVDAPVWRDGAFYVHVDQPEQLGRYVFSGLDEDAIRACVGQIDRPFVFLKVCAPGDYVRPLLPAGWTIAEPGYMMTAPVATMLDTPQLPTGYTVTITCEGQVLFAHIHDAKGEEAATGRMVTMGDLVMYDRIITSEQHQRRGLGSTIMRSLAREADALGIRDATLCATPAGRALYTSLGWSLHSDYTTASLAA